MNLASISSFVGVYILITVLLANVLLYTPWSWSIKLACCAMVGALFYFSYLALPPLLGWPTTEALPGSFNLNGLHVVEPDKGGHSNGNIYIWVTDKMSSSTEDIPRAYELPFNSVLYTRLVNAGNRLRKGLPQLGKIDADVPTLKGPGNETVPNIEFYDEPEPLFPEK